jgi:hypothetical protein
MFKKLGLSLFALVAAAGIALAGGAFNGFPIVGDTAGTTCLSFGNNGVCNQFSPVGPGDVPPLSTFPADTYLAGNPQTVNIPVTLTGGVVQDASPLTGTTVAVSQGTNKLILTPAATIATLTVTLPPATQLLDGQEFFFYSNNTVTALTITPGTGTTITPAASTTIPAAAPIKYVYVQTSATAGVWQAF